MKKRFIFRALILTLLLSVIISALVTLLTKNKDAYKTGDKSPNFELAQVNINHKQETIQLRDFRAGGPYVNHIGLIIILVATILRMTPLLYLDDYIWVREDEQLVIPGTNNE